MFSGVNFIISWRRVTYWLWDCIGSTFLSRLWCSFSTPPQDWVLELGRRNWKSYATGQWIPEMLEVLGMCYFCCCRHLKKCTSNILFWNYCWSSEVQEFLASPHHGSRKKQIQDILIWHTYFCCCQREVLYLNVKTKLATADLREMIWWSQSSF